jgi:hypothetical protein
MAEIKIEKKKPVWPWIILVIAIIAIIAFLLYNNSDEADDYADDVTSDQVDDMDSTIYNDTVVDDTYNTQQDSMDMMMPLTETMRDTSRLGIDSTYTKTAFYNVAKATLMKARALQINTSPALTDLEQYVNETTGMEDTRMPNSEGEFDIKKISNTIVSVMETIQTTNVPTMKQSIAGLKTTAGKLNATTDLAKQQRNIQAFVRQAYNVLNSINS